jgi:hypothetical protein
MTSGFFIEQFLKNFVPASSGVARAGQITRAEASGVRHCYEGPLSSQRDKKVSSKQALRTVLSRPSEINT